MKIYNCNPCKRENICPPLPPIPPSPYYPIPGPPGPPGPMGPRGPQGPAGTIEQYASFYALAPADNPDAIDPGERVAFPNARLATAGITTTNGEVFNIRDAGVYQVNFRVNSSEAGQLQVELNGVPVVSSVYGTAGTNGEISGNMILNIPANSQFALINPATETTIITVQPNAGGTLPTTSEISFVKLA